MLFPLLEIGQKPRSKTVFNQSREVPDAKILQLVYCRWMPLKNQKGFLEQLFSIPANSTALMGESCFYQSPTRFSVKWPQTLFSGRSRLKAHVMCGQSVQASRARGVQNILYLWRRHSTSAHAQWLPQDSYCFFIKNVGRYIMIYEDRTAGQRYWLL